MEELKINESVEVIIGFKEDKKVIYEIFKRGFDFVCSLLAIVVFSPLLLLIALAIKIDSKGPVVFTHTRLGKDGKKIGVYKFRTMVENAEDVLRNMPEGLKKEFEINFKLENDPRTTRIGKVLRKTSLDELLQLFNILIGNMTIVGPRPIVEKELSKYEQYRDKLLTVKPGLTGNWQANGRSNTTYEQRVALDMEYIDKRNLWMDLKIIFKTVAVVFDRAGAR